jgi:hypothetical protein
MYGRVSLIEGWNLWIGILIAIRLELQREMILLISENETKGLLHLISHISYDTYWSLAYSRRQGDDNVRC